MKVLVVSDTHGNYLAPLTIFQETGADLVIHLGDVLDDALTLEQMLDRPVIKVPGNCDPGAKEPRELLETIAGTRFFITHGDHYRVKNGLHRLVEKARELKAAVALFGHTHRPLSQKEDGVLLINPGTLMAGSDAKSYALLTVTPFKITSEIIHLP